MRKSYAFPFTPHGSAERKSLYSSRLLSFSNLRKFLRKLKASYANPT